MKLLKRVLYILAPFLLAWPAQVVSLTFLSLVFGNFEWQWLLLDPELLIGFKYFYSILISLYYGVWIDIPVALLLFYFSYRWYRSPSKKTAFRIFAVWFFVFLLSGLLEFGGPTQ